MKPIILLLTSALAAALPAGASSIDWTAGVPYTYDPAGNVRRIGSDDQVYDAVGRLVQSDISGIRRTFKYDRFGNRKTCWQAPGTECQNGHSVLTPTNRISAVGYDAAGNAESFEGHHYTYDLLNMQVARDTATTLATEYVYTAEDERIAIYSPNPGTWRWTLRDGSAKVIREMTSHNGAGGALSTEGWTWTRDYVWRDGQLLASRQIASGQTIPSRYHYHIDHLGSPRRITNDSNQAVGTHDYHAFGPETDDGANEPALSLLKYTGHERDLDGPTGGAVLDYMHARYYSAMAGRFLSVDRVLGTPPAPQSWNRYSYAHGNPLTNVDPDGNVVIGATSSREMIAHAYANSPTFRAQYDAANHNAAIVADLSWTSQMATHSRGNTNPNQRTLVVQHDSNNAVLFNTRGQLLVRATSFRTTLPAGSRAGVLGHELTHVNEGSTSGYARTKDSLIPQAPTTYPNPDVKNGYESEAANTNEEQIIKELAAGGDQKLTPAQEKDVFGPSEQFRKWSRKDQARCRDDATCFSTNPPQ